MCFFEVSKSGDRFNILIKQDLSLLDKKFEALRKSLNKHSEHLFKFLEHEDVPYENNASERGVRPLKSKTESQRNV